jgi:hypothetical protein
VRAIAAMLPVGDRVALLNPISIDFRWPLP